MNALRPHLRECGGDLVEACFTGGLDEHQIAGGDNEVNTVPGLTSYSRYPRMMAASGLPLAEVIDRMVALALEGTAVAG